MPDGKVLIVGTTADYVEIMHSRYKDQTFFLTDKMERLKASEISPGPQYEILTNLASFSDAQADLNNFLSNSDEKINGIACFDCESLLLASRLASLLDLPFHSLESISASRNKALTKDIWRKNNVSCPKSAMLKDSDSLQDFIETASLPIVLKPLTGSGSELTFICTTKDETLKKFKFIINRLKKHANKRMFGRDAVMDKTATPYKTAAAEEFIDGQEYSSDFLLFDNEIKIIRTAKKIIDNKLGLGTAFAYQIPAVLPEKINKSSLSALLKHAANSLGIQQGICMADFIIRDNIPFLLEITPRPGGDCLPPLILESSGLDIFKLALDVARNIPIALPDESKWNPVVGVRFIAIKDGKIKKIDASLLKADARVLRCHIRCNIGHKIILPPDNYDSRILGYCIFKPFNMQKIEKESREISQKLQVVTEDKK